MYFLASRSQTWRRIKLRVSGRENRQNWEQVTIWRTRGLRECLGPKCWQCEGCVCLPGKRLGNAALGILISLEKKPNFSDIRCSPTEMAQPGNLTVNPIINNPYCQAQSCPSVFSALCLNITEHPRITTLLRKTSNMNDRDQNTQTGKSNLEKNTDSMQEKETKNKLIKTWTNKKDYSCYS